VNPDDVWGDVSIFRCILERRRVMAPREDSALRARLDSSSEMSHLEARRLGPSEDKITQAAETRS